MRSSLEAALSLAAMLALPYIVDIKVDTGLMPRVNGMQGSFSCA